jgi:hypothetical protein
MILRLDLMRCFLLYLFEFFLVFIFRDNCFCVIKLKNIAMIPDDLVGLSKVKFACLAEQKTFRRRKKCRNFTS